MTITTAHLALIVSVLAFVVSIASLWANSLRPFKLRLFHDAPTFTLYKITPNISGDEDNQTWWIPCFDIGLSFYNSGRRPGEILDVRIVAKLEGHGGNRTFTFYPRYIVNYAGFQKDRPDRFKWLSTAIIRLWHPFALGGQGEKDLHVVLESARWDHKERGNMKLTLEVISSDKRKWQQWASYSLYIFEDIFDDRSSCTVYDDKTEDLRKLKS